jgi:hypothetical protein
MNDTFAALFYDLGATILPWYIALSMYKALELSRFIPMAGAAFYKATRGRYSVFGSMLMMGGLLWVIVPLTLPYLLYREGFSFFSPDHQGTRSG